MLLHCILKKEFNQNRQDGFKQDQWTWCSNTTEQEKHPSGEWMRKTSIAWSEKTKIKKHWDQELNQKHLNNNNCKNQTWLQPHEPELFILYFLEQEKRLPLSWVCSLFLQRGNSRLKVEPSWNVLQRTFYEPRRTLSKHFSPSLFYLVLFLQNRTFGGKIPLETAGVQTCVIKFASNLCRRIKRNQPEELLCREI